MGFAELLIEWHSLTLKTVAARLNEVRKPDVPFNMDTVGAAISRLKGFSNNTEVFEFVVENGVLGTYNFLNNNP